MNKYKVTRGDVSREIEAENEAEARRKFDAPEVTTEVVILEAALPTPEKCCYRVTWGPESRDVWAVHEDDAWSQFVGGNENSIAYKYPATHPRIIEKLDAEGNVVKADAKADDSHDTGASAVADLNVQDAKDSISRMHSRDKLQNIINHDKRASVVDAARARQTELGGS